MGRNVIEFENVSKLYQLGLVGTGTLSHDLRRWWIVNVMQQEDPYLKVGQVNDRSSKGDSDFVFALKDITFNVKQGDVVGIIGKNGAGKSTLLKLLSRITAPTTGVIRSRGRIASLLEVGTGFHAELTGRENIYMNGSILGMKKKEIDAKLEEIVDFAGVERYVDTPIKRYSSGMKVRLGFAVAAFLEPEILIVDEVLAVGDAEFQKKALGKMQSVAHGEGRTVLFVSHNMAAVKSLCRSGLLLENGMMNDYGPVEEIVNKYLSDGGGTQNHCVCEGSRGYSKDGLEILEIGVRPKGGDWDDLINVGQQLELVIRYRVTKPFEVFWLTYHFKNSSGAKVFSASGATQMDARHEPGVYEQVCFIPDHFLNWGVFYVDLFTFRDNAQIVLRLNDIINFTVNNMPVELGGWMGREPGDVTPQLPFTRNRLE